LEGLLKTMHKGIKHVGKVPVALRQGRDLNERLKNLQKKLDKAVTSEDFEQAASLRDEIKLTKDQLDNMVTR
jgi:protein arginine kinase activator